jgi:hypothetical protein
MAIKAATLCGKANLAADWAQRCMATWKKIEGLDEVSVLDDGTLDQAAIAGFPFQDVPFRFVFGAQHEDAMASFLEPFPNLLTMRRRSLVWRKMLDMIVSFRAELRALYIDSDVYVVQKVALPDRAGDLCTMFEGIPGGYAASPQFALRERYVMGLNSGLILFRPQAIDWEGLEWLAKRYFISVRDPWLTEQTAWAALSCRVLGTFHFSPTCVRVFPGTWKHSAISIRRHRISYLGSNRPVSRLDEVLALLEGSAIVHFCSLGKRWISQFDSVQRDLKDPPTVTLPIISGRCPNLLGRMVMALRFLRLQF